MKDAFSSTRQFVLNKRIVTVDSVSGRIVTEDLGLRSVIKQFRFRRYDMNTPQMLWLLQQAKSGRNT